MATGRSPLGPREATTALVRLDLGSLPEAGAPLPESIKQAALRVLRATTPGWRETDSNNGDDRQQHQQQKEGRGGASNDSDNDNDNDIDDDNANGGGFTMRALTGGMTNVVFRCSKPRGDNRTVLLRSYGKGTEMFFSRGVELRIFELLAEKGFGPALLATLEDGRVEEFLEGRALEAKDLREPVIFSRIAERIAELHGLRLDIGTGDASTPIIFRSLEEFHRKALELCGESYGGIDVLELGRLAAKLRESLEGSAASKNVVFCHNDLQCGNIMYKDPASSAATTTSDRGGGTGGGSSNEPTSCTGDKIALSPGQTSARLLSLIDYEYAGYNPRAFDLGNHFCEWMADYSAAEPHVLDLEKYPTSEEREMICAAYLGAMSAVPGGEVSSEEVEGLVSEADAYSLASHLLWAMWALLQSKSDTAAAGFDYLKYAAERIRAYRHFHGRFHTETPLAAK